jgi:outer membrane protein assembly factor BamE (lipoprotein component of BamABCDE complex)
LNLEHGPDYVTSGRIAKESRAWPATASSAAVLAAALALGACAPTSTHGFTPQMETLDTVAAGIDTRSSVLSKLGRPSASGTFDSANWYYVASRMEQRLFYAPEVVERTVVAIRFDEAGLVERVDRFGLEDGRIVNAAHRDDAHLRPRAHRDAAAVQQCRPHRPGFAARQLTGQAGAAISTASPPRTAV